MPSLSKKRMPRIDMDKGRMDYLRQGVRDLGRLLKEIICIDSSITKLEDCFNCSKFDSIVKAVYTLTGIVEHLLQWKAENPTRNLL